MPLLKRESDLYPEDLFDLDPQRFPWFVAHVRSRQEKVLARHLTPQGSQAGVPFYLPLTENVITSGGRKRKSWLPLFSGYVFARGQSVERLHALKSNVVVNVLEVQDQALLNGELKQIHDLQQRGARLVAYPDLVVGDRVRIREGVFAGYEGHIAKERGETRLVVSVTMLAASVLVDLDRDALAPVKPALQTRTN